VFDAVMFTQQDLKSDDDQEWGIQLIDAVGHPPRSSSFEVWDKVP
jgi:hypothetical protein